MGQFILRPYVSWYPEILNICQSVKEYFPLLLFSFTISLSFSFAISLSDSFIINFISFLFHSLFIHSFFILFSFTIVIDSIFNPSITAHSIYIHPPLIYFHSIQTIKKPMIIARDHLKAQLGYLQVILVIKDVLTLSWNYSMEPNPSIRKDPGGMPLITTLRRILSHYRIFISLLLLTLMK